MQIIMPVPDGEERMQMLDINEIRRELMLDPLASSDQSNTDSVSNPKITVSFQIIVRNSIVCHNHFWFLFQPDPIVDLTTSDSSPAA